MKQDDGWPTVAPGSRSRAQGILHLLRPALVLLLFFLPVASVAAGLPATRVTHAAGHWVLENDRLRVTVDPGPGRLQVLDKKSGYTWRQPVQAESHAAVMIPRRLAPPTLDADLSEWTSQPTVRLTSRMTTADAPKVDSDQDCSANAWCAWDDRNFYLAAAVRDDILQFGPADNPTWWEKDSLECWIGHTQVGLSLNPGGSEVRTADGPVPGARVVVRVRPGGYAVEAAIPWSALPDAPGRQIGNRFPFALGVNDADASGVREGQLYFPTTWVHSDPSTFVSAVLADPSGAAPPSGEGAGEQFRGIHTIPGGLAFIGDFGSTRGKPNAVQVSLQLRGPDLEVTADMADRAVPIDPFPFLQPFILDSRQGVLAVADYCDGHLYPLDLDPFPQTYFSGDRLDMPWVGLTDLKSGIGYAMILETSDDSAVRANKQPAGSRRLTAPQVIWSPSKGRFGYPRRLRYSFVSSGGYVALAMAYRTYAQQQGLIVPFAEKVKKNPNLRRLFGAPDVWGNATLSFARQAKQDGVDKMLIHGRTSPAEMKAIRNLGYLPSEYDNYTDILPADAAHPVDSSHDLIPQHVVLQQDGTRMTAWKTWDGLQYMKRCPDFWVPAAQKVIPAVLREYPFLGRFIDVTTAERLYECFDPDHPLTRGDKRRRGEDLLRYVRSQGLVVGGEHGIWWGVPSLDYIEGMMSSSYYSWPAGYLIHPKTKDQEFTDPSGHKLGPWANYARWGIGYQWRAPLWELVFHDCVVSTWYWGDASDFLLQAAPEITPRKDAFNILYGTIPLLWADQEGSWQRDRDVFLRTYRNTCKLHEILAGSRLMDHQFLTPDHALQRTRFSDGTVVTVNFGSAPAAAVSEGKRVVLPENGWVVQGPRIQQSRMMVGGKTVTTIRTASYFYSDSGGAAIAAHVTAKDEIRLIAGHARGPAWFRPAVLSPGWDLRTTRIFSVDGQGRALHPAPAARAGGQFRIGPFPVDTALVFYCRSRSYVPELQVTAGGALQAVQGGKALLSAVVSNPGRAPARDVRVAFYADSVESGRRIGGETFTLAPGQRRRIALTVDTRPLDGSHRIVVAAAVPHPVPGFGPVESDAAVPLYVAPDYSAWPHRKRLRIDSGSLTREDAVVVSPISLPGADPASVRLVETDSLGRMQRILPVQLDILPSGKQVICLVLPGRTLAHTTRWAVVLWAGSEHRPAFFAPPSRIWDARTRTIDASTYRVSFQNGSLGDVAARSGAGYGKPFISSLIYSSEATGWTDEPGAVESFQVLHSGPVRTMVRVTKRLKAGVVYQKTYTFYPDRFEVDIHLEKPSSAIYSRAYYLRPGEFTDSGGVRAQVDGQGNDEGVSGKTKNPRWYAVTGAGWAHSCIALSPAPGLTYWDDTSAWGGIGFNSTGEDQRLSYVIHSGVPGPGFASQDLAEISDPLELAASVGPDFPSTGAR